MALNLTYLILGLIIGWYSKQLLNLLKSALTEISEIKKQINEKTGLLNLLKKAGHKDNIYIKKDTNLEDIGL